VVHGQKKKSKNIKYETLNKKYKEGKNIKRQSSKGIQQMQSSKGRVWYL
jgi:hypothetical protein